MLRNGAVRYRGIMAIVVRRTAHDRGRRQGRDTLVQRFVFEGDGVRAASITDVLLAAPLTGEGSVFGSRPGSEVDRVDGSRILRGFSPAPGFRFDVELSQRGGDELLVRFTQPDRNVPYLQGDLIWTLRDEPEGAVLEEQINTDRALEVVSDPLGGPRPSLRRWLFFRMGHKQVMARATSNIAALADRPTH